MEKKEIFSQVIHMEERIGTFHDELGELKEQLAMLIEENHALALENQHLRKLLDEKDTSEQGNDTTTSSPGKKSVGEGHDNLARLYHEGFHICNMHYGSLRANGDCLFCLSFLNQK
ncbi:DNA replication initiation control protein YabA [Salibacterium aidingense]|uniref:DNA replication initiation control protein YabA n=1 Tax=Salibacterium aidingense TaxID=384933 RepID=UPI000402AC04|nr:DNA replication initiation control protein YabA [Salibacterium aidingense]